MPCAHPRFTCAVLGHFARYPKVFGSVVDK